MAVKTPAHIGTDPETLASAGRWEVARVVLAAVYLLGGVAHLVLAASSMDLYESFADQALVGVYTDLWRDAVVPHLAILVPLVGLFELAVGAALLWRGRAVRLGHAGGALFQTGLVLSGPWGPVNALLALVHGLAFGRAYPRSVLARRRDWRRG